jgi:hypothetical protein
MTMPRGSHDNHGNVEIRFNSQGETLPAPNGGKYLPCEHCGIVVEVPINQVSAYCGECCVDCGERGDHHCPAWCDEPGCHECNRAGGQL